MRIALVITICFLAVCQVSAAPGGNKNTANQKPQTNDTVSGHVDSDMLLKQANEDVQNQDYQAAEVKFKKIIEQRPDFFNAYYNLFVSLREQNRFAEAISWLSKTTNFKLDPVQKSEIFLLLGDAAEKLDDQAQGLARYLSAYAIRSNNADAMKNIARIYLVQEKLDEAFALYKKALDLKPNDFLIHFGLAWIYGKRKDTAKAIEEYKISIQENPKYWRSHMNLGLAYSYSDMYEEAIPEYKTAIELKADYPDAWYDLGNAYRYKGQYEEMKTCYQKAIDLKPDFKEAAYNMACYFAIKKDKPEALDWLKRSIILDPGLKKKAVHDNDFQFLKDDMDFKALVK